MPVNLLNEGVLNNYLTDIVYHGGKIPQYAGGNFKSADWVEQNKDGITKAILSQYVKYRLRSHLTDDETYPFLVPISKRDGLPPWAERSLDEGKKIFEFDARKMSNDMNQKIMEVRDFLYSSAESYVSKVVTTARHTKQSPKIRLDYLKTNNEYDTFEKALVASEKWHTLMAIRAEKIARDKELFDKSINGTQFVMDLPDGMAAYQLTTSEALDFESEYMGHCVGKGGYDKDVSDGSIQIYSIRDKNGEPHATFEIQNNEIIQCKGKGNKAPVQRYKPAIWDFIEQKNFDLKDDIANIGIIKQDGKHYNLYNLPKGFTLKANLDFSNQELTELPDLSHIILDGDFVCYNNRLTSLKGVPKEIKGSLVCSFNELTSLEGAPKKIGENFSCFGNLLTSLKGGPIEVGGTYNCFSNQLESLEGAPSIVGKDFNCAANNLSSLKNAPKEVGGSFDCSQNPSLKDKPENFSKIGCKNENEISYNLVKRFRNQH